MVYFTFLDAFKSAILNVLENRNIVPSFFFRFTMNFSFTNWAERFPFIKVRGCAKLYRKLQTTQLLCVITNNKPIHTYIHNTYTI